MMAAKNERIGFRVSSGIKTVLSQIAKKEGRSVAQICDLFLRGGINEYEKEGGSYIHRLLGRSRQGQIATKALLLDISAMAHCLIILEQGMVTASGFSI